MAQQRIWYLGFVWCSDNLIIIGKSPSWFTHCPEEEQSWIQQRIGFLVSHVENNWDANRSHLLVVILWSFSPSQQNCRSTTASLRNYVGNIWCHGKSFSEVAAPVLFTIVSPTLTQGLAYSGCPQISVIEKWKSRFKLLLHLQLVVQLWIHESSHSRAWGVLEYTMRQFFHLSRVLGGGNNCDVSEAMWTGFVIIVVMRMAFNTGSLDVRVRWGSRPGFLLSQLCEYGQDT